jgi:glutamate carboxypeptidase
MKSSEFDPRSLLKWCTSETDALLDCLRQAVEIESPSGSKDAIDAMARFFAGQFSAAGAPARLLPHATVGAAVTAELPATVQNARRDGAKPVLLLGHHDTVWGVGTLDTMPFKVRAGRAHGPGIFDMKSGIVCALWAIKALQALGIPRACPVRLFLNPDEEVASRAFRKELQAEARRARAVLVLEPALGKKGALKTARKGVGEFRLTVLGRPAHAGINPAAGVNAITELARQLLRVEEMADPKGGLTLTVGVIEGGTRTNVVPELAQARIDVRVPRLADARRIERKMRSLKPVNPEARLVIEGGVNRPPLERVRAAALFELAREIGRKMGFELQEGSTGGGSDGNFTAALGIPTLDGLGGVGDGAHAHHEHVIIRELPRRAALLAALIASM